MLKYALIGVSVKKLKTMKSLKYIYNDHYIEFLQGGNNVMVNATQMAKTFNKEVYQFTRIDETKNFISACLKPQICGLLGVKSESDLIVSKQKSGTLMHRILALKFAAWLDPDFEVWVYSTIDRILYSHFQEMKSATLEKISIEKEREQVREELLRKYPKDFSKFLELEGKLTIADRKRINAIKASTMELRLNFDENNQGTILR
jgi:hypothetical protein